MKTPFFSVIIPAYNSENFIERTIRSVLSQTYDQFELIIVDDGSSDNTAKILSKFSSTDARIRIITTPNSGGPTTPTNIGINLSNGEYITFLDHDDVWKPHKLERLLEFIEDNASIGFIASNVEHYNEKTKNTTLSDLRLVNGNLPKSDVLAGNYFNTFSMLTIKRSVLERVGSLDTSLRMFADFDLVTRMITHDIPYQFLPDILVTYYIHDSNTSKLSTSAYERAKDLKKIIEKYQKTYKKFPDAQSNVLHAIARLHLYLEDRKQAVYYFKMAIKSHPRKMSNYIRLFAAYFGNNPYSKIKTLREKAFRKL